MLDSTTTDPLPPGAAEARAVPGRGRAGSVWGVAGAMLLVIGAAAVALRHGNPVPAAATRDPRPASNAAGPRSTPPGPPPSVSVAAVPAEVRLLERVVVGDGTVVPWQELSVGAELGGLRVRDVLAEEGAKVRLGQLLASLDTAVPAAQAAQAEAAVAEAEAASRVARLDLERATELSRGAVAARQTVEQRQAAARQAEARLAAARARRDEAAARLAQTRVLAPADGTVVRRSVQLGAVVSAGEEMFRLLRDDRLELDARVPELDLGAVRPGQPVRVLHGDREIRATVRAVAPAVAAETRLGTVRVALPPGAGLLPGMFARAEIRSDARQAIAVPRSALVFHDGAAAMFVLEDGGRASLRRLTTGVHRHGLVEVTAGLRAGERVVISGAGFLADGDRVRAVPALPPSEEALLAGREAQDAHQPRSR